MPLTAPAALLGAALLVATFAVAVPPRPTTAGDPHRAAKVAFQSMRDGPGATVPGQAVPGQAVPGQAVPGQADRARWASGPSGSDAAASGPPTPAAGGSGRSRIGRPTPGTAAPGSAAPRTAAPRTAAPRTGFRWPIQGRPVIGRRFTVGPQPWSPGHRGVDLVAGPGTPLLAPGPGTVHFSGTVVSRGVLTLDHGGGLLTSYEPVRSAVATGAQVSAGQVIGWITPTGGHCPVSCLHWGARRDGAYLDPLTLLAAWRGPPILLPVP